MDSNSTPVVIISAFGRGHWMAVELKAAGVPVTLIDITEQLGAWAPEDWEGPFGFHKTEKLTARQWDRVNQDEVPILVPQGFSLFLSDGPVEFQGPNNKHRVEKLGFDLNAFSQGGQWRDFPFAKKWLYEALSAISSTVQVHNPEFSKVCNPLSVASPFYFRHGTRKGLLKSLEWVKNHGVKVLEKVQVLDVSLENRTKVSGIELKQDERSDFVKTEQIIWCLSGEETGMIGAKVQNALFPKGIVESRWCWLRFRLKIKESYRRDLLPTYFLMIQDPYLPWTHENFVVVIRTASSEFFDVWMKLPTEQRFNKQYLTERGEAATALLQNRLFEDEVLIQDYPQEFNYTYSQMGPPRFPIFDLDQSKRRGARAIDNLIQDSPETWPRHGWEGQFESQIAVVVELKVWWKRKEEIRMKAEERKRRKEKSSERENEL